jgi:hypothetical protein
MVLLVSVARRHVGVMGLSRISVLERSVRILAVDCKLALGSDGARIGSSSVGGC